MVTRKTTLIALLCAFTAPLFSQIFDSGFQPFITRPGEVSELAVLPDGRYYAAGSFSWANRAERRNIARFLPDGSLDDGFSPGPGFSITALALQPDGKVLLGGSFAEEGAPEGITVIRLNSDGSLDDSFRAGFAPDGNFADIQMENNGTILVGGSFNHFDGQVSQGVVRLSNTGELLASIPLSANGIFVSSLAVQSNGRFMVGGTMDEKGYLSYHEYSGAPVPGFDFSITLPGTTNILTAVRDLSLDSQGRFAFSASTFLIRYAVGIINPNGSYGAWDYVFGIPQSIVVDGSDNIFVAGDYNGVSAVHAFDPITGLQTYSGGWGADGLIRKVALVPGGGFIAGGHFSSFDGRARLGIVRLDAAGAPAGGFHGVLERTGMVRSIVRSGSDKVYISGEFAMVGDTYTPNIARIRLDNGVADPDFQNPGISYRNEVPCITLDAQGRILAAGTNVDNADNPHEAPLMRLLPNGAFDPTFQLNPAAYPVGRLAKVFPLDNGQLLAIGNFTVFDGGIAASKVALYNADGSLVRSFSNRIQVADATEAIRLNDGKILLGGRDIRYDGAAPQHIIRLSAGLERDPAFQSPAGLLCTSGSRFKFTEQDDGKILVGGSFRTDPSQNIPFRMARLEADGAIDGSFQLPGAFDNSEPYVDGGVRRMLCLPDGRILAVGHFDSLGLSPAPCITLLENNGEIANNMQSLNFERQFLFDAVLLDNGDLLVGGILSDSSRPWQTGMARIVNANLLTAGIAGQIRTPGGAPVEGVEIDIAGPVSENMLTGADGAYGFSGQLPAGGYTIIPSLNTSYTNGVSTYDLLLISQHLLGVNRFDDPYRIIAADVNNSHSVTTLDLISLQRLILGQVPAFPNNASWRFVDAAYIFPNPLNPWQEPFPEVINLPGIPPGGIQGANFIAIKVGDVNGSAVTNPAPSLRSQPPHFQLWAQDVEFEAGELVRVPVTAEGLGAIRALQFTLRFEPSALRLEDAGYGLMQEEDFGFSFLDEGWITAGCYRLPEQAGPETPFFTLTFRTRRAGSVKQFLSIGADVTPAEAYSAEGQVFRLELAFRPAPAKPARLLGNAPNPFSEATTISFDMERPGEATLLIHSADGRLLRQWSGWREAGRQEVRVSAEGLPEGVVYYTLSTARAAVTRSMVVRR